MNYKIVRTDEEIDDLVNECSEAENDGRTAYPGMTYEQGLLHGIRLAVAAYFSLPLQLLADRSRKTHLCLARHIAMYLIREHTAYSLRVIAREFGRSDHTTVIHAIKAIQDRIDTDPAVERHVAVLQAQVQELKYLRVQ